jgi:hypothetical protein
LNAPSAGGSDSAAVTGSGGSIARAEGAERHSTT